MSIWVLILFIAGALSFALATLGIGGKLNLLAFGLFCWILIPLSNYINAH